MVKKRVYERLNSRTLCSWEFWWKSVNLYFFDVYEVDLRNGLSFCVYLCLLCGNTNSFGIYNMKNGIFGWFGVENASFELSWQETLAGPSLSERVANSSPQLAAARYEQVIHWWCSLKLAEPSLSEQHCDSNFLIVVLSVIRHL